MNKTIVKMKFGSVLYGTNTPSSDQDFKSVFLPDAKELVLQKAAKHINQSTKQNSVDKNASTDIDTEAFSIQSYFKLLLEGQTVALDCFFCPDEFILEKTDLWDKIVANKDLFLHSGTSAFVGYTRQQAAKYGVKGFRVSSLRTVLEWLSWYKDYQRLSDIGPDAIYRWICETGNEHIKLSEIQTKIGPELYLEVCNRKVPLHATVKYAKEIYKKIFDMYGERALKAEKNEGVDWKALSHAVRVANESIELLNTGKIIFPRPDRVLLLEIKSGNISYKEVERIIETGLLKVEEAQKNSLLPKEPNYKAVEQLLYEIHLDIIRELL